MRFLKRILPHLSIACSLALLVVEILNVYNPMMGFLFGTPALVLISAACVISVITAIMACASWRRERQWRRVESSSGRHSRT